MKGRSDTWHEMSNIFDTCEPIGSANDIETLYENIGGDFVYMAMRNYPYKDMEMPANPVDAACEKFKLISFPFEEKKTFNTGMSL